MPNTLPFAKRGRRAPTPTLSVDCLANSRGIVFEESPVAESLIHDVLAAADETPTTHGLFPWRFMIVRGEQNHEKLRIVLKKKAPNLADAPVVFVAYTVDSAAPRASDQAAPEKPLSPATRKALAEELSRQVTLSLNYMALAAEAADHTLAATTAVDTRIIKEQFGLESAREVVAIIALGKARQPEPPATAPDAVIEPIEQAVA